MLTAQRQRFGTSLNGHLLIVLLIGVVIWAILQWWISMASDNISANNTLESLQVGEAPLLSVEIVERSQDQARGLSNRDSLAENTGMLFVYDEAQYRTFWMKEMNFSIDILWIEQGVVVGITPDVPAPEPGTIETELALYDSPRPVDWVLEVNAGWSAEHGIGIGDVVEIRAVD